MNFGKVLTAMVTPFDKELEVDYKRTKKLVEHLIATGTDTIVVAGTTGESPTLTKDEKLLLLKQVKQTANKRAKVIANAGTNNTVETIQFVSQIEDLGFADGIMLVNPYYNKPSQEAMYQHFKSIAESTELPIMLYNIPSRTGVNLEAETTIRLAEIPNIVAIKESSGNLSQITKVISSTPDTFSLYSGDDNLTLPILSVGGKGVVSVASHVIGHKIKNMIEYYERGNVKKAMELHQKYLSFFEDLFFTTNPVPVKHMLNQNGIKVGGVRAPLIELTDNEKAFVKIVLGNIH